MPSQDAVLRAVQAAIAEVNLVLPPDEALDPTPDAELITRLDSLGVVNLLLATESAVEQQLGRQVSLTDLLEADPSSTPLRTVGGLVALVQSRIEASA